MSSQKRLFGDEPAPWEVDNQSDELAATVVFAEGPPGGFDYSVPDNLAPKVEAGRRLRVPLGRNNRPVIGYCVGVERKAFGARKRKPVVAVLDGRSLLSTAMLRLTHWIAEHYLCPWGQVLDAVVPAGVHQQAGTRLTTVLSVERRLAAGPGKPAMPKTQQAILDVLAASAKPLTVAELCRLAHCSTGPIAKLRQKGFIRSSVERIGQNRPGDGVVQRQAGLTLNPDQQAALRTILAPLGDRRHQTVLIHGVTGSGKTEVYLQACQEVAAFGRQAIVLVPEISLTPQTLERFRSRFDRVAVLHSHLSDADRHQQWQRIADGHVQVVVGARARFSLPHHTSGWWCWTRSTRARSNRIPRRAITPAMWPFGVPRWNRCRWCSARPHPLSSRGTELRPANMCSSRCRGEFSIDRFRGWAPSTCATTSSAGSREVRLAMSCTARCTKRSATEDK